MRSPVPLYDSLAPAYEEHFAVPHRRAYDDLAWEICSAVLPAAPAVVVDVGCGVGRWAHRLLDGGHRVIGIEPSTAMAERAAERLGGRHTFTLLPARAEDVDLPPGAADAVVAMGSLQYTEDPAAMLARAARWLRPGGVLCVLVDSLQALVVELLAAGRHAEAAERLRTRRGTWRLNGVEADLHLFDQGRLRRDLTGAGCDVVRVAGLLVGATAYGREGLQRRLGTDYAAALASERALAEVPELADFGKQLLMVATRREGP